MWSCSPSIHARQPIPRFLEILPTEQDVFDDVLWVLNEALWLSLCRLKCGVGSESTARHRVDIQGPGTSSKAKQIVTAPRGGELLYRH